MKKSKKINSNNQVHGKLETVENPQTLAQVWGETSVDGKYKTDNLDEYNAQLQEMNLVDLQDHAVEVGFAPGDNRKMLVQKLKNEFTRHINGFRVPPKGKDNSKNDKEALRILAEGR